MIITGNNVIVTKIDYKIVAKEKVFKTKFGYAPFDFETYKKIKKIKAVANISLLRQKRYNKWARKLKKNRTTPAPIFCELFHEIKVEKKKHWNPVLFRYETGTDEQDFCREKQFAYNFVGVTLFDIDTKSFRQRIMELWAYAKDIRQNPEEIMDVPKFYNHLDIDELYSICRTWFDENY